MTMETVTIAQLNAQSIQSNGKKASGNIVQRHIKRIGYADDNVRMSKSKILCRIIPKEIIMPSGITLFSKIEYTAIFLPCPKINLYCHFL